MDPITTIALLIGSLDQVINLVVKLAAIMKQQANMTPAQEAAFQAKLAALKAKWASELQPDSSPVDPPGYPYM